MNNLTQNYETILKHLQNICGDMKNYNQIRKPKMSNLELASLNIIAEYMSISSELQLFRQLKGSYLEAKIERSVYNRRCRKLFDYTEAIRKRLSEKFRQFTDVFVVDTMPTPICKNARVVRSSICSTYEIKLAFKYCSAQNSRYFGYKLHAVCDKNGVFPSFDITPTNVHDINYLNAKWVSDE